MTTQNGLRIIRCPICGFSITAPKSEPLPDDGPTCAMGHESAAMEVADVKEPGRG